MAKYRLTRQQQEISEHISVPERFYLKLDSLQELRTGKSQQVLQKFEEGRLIQNPFKGLVNGGNQP